MPKPWGSWALPDKDCGRFPGYRGSARDKPEAKRLLAAAGYGPGKPLQVEMVTRTSPSTGRRVVRGRPAAPGRRGGVNLKQMDTTAWFPALARRDYLIGANLTARGIDDPDVYFYENFKCGTSRNYTDYCNEAVDRLIDQQSQELDRDKRQKLVWQIQTQARVRRGPPHAGLAQGVLHPVALREEPRRAQLAVQLGPHAGRLARQVDSGRTSRLWLDK